MASSKELFRQAWGSFPTGVSVITTIQENGLAHYMTANAICSVSLEPPLVILCLGHTRNTHRAVSRSGGFAINILAEGQRELAARYASGQWAEGELPPGGLHSLPSGAPALNNAIAVMDCQVVARHEAGDHTIFMAEVEHVEVQPGEPLLFYRGEYTSLAKSPASPRTTVG